MNRRLWVHAAALALTVATCAATAPAAAAADPVTPSSGGASGPGAAATGYLQARSAAITSADPGARLAEWLVPGSGIAGTETLIAQGVARRSRQLGHAIESVKCEVDVLDAQPAEGSRSATVAAYAITTIVWRASSGALDTEASGIDHTLSLKLVGDTWKVAADAYSDVMRPNYLQAAGASATRVRRAGRALERASTAVRSPRAEGPDRAVSARRYSDILKYDRPAAQAYADRYALSYNPTYVRFGADCADFASQCARAGDMPQSLGGWESGWWYDKHGTSSPSNDTYSLSWINVTKQMGFWNTRRTDWASSAGVLSRGDFIYYDWTGDGFWDHVAVVAGTNSAGQKVVDAHSTNYYRVYWKLGSSSTRYKYAKTRAQWVV